MFALAGIDLLSGFVLYFLISAVILGILAIAIFIGFNLKRETVNTRFRRIWNAYFSALYSVGQAKGFALGLGLGLENFPPSKIDIAARYTAVIISAHHSFLTHAYTEVLSENNAVLKPVKEHFELKSEISKNTFEAGFKLYRDNREFFRQESEFLGFSIDLAKPYEDRLSKEGLISSTDT